MNSQERFDRVHEIFTRAKALHGEERDRYLDEARGSDAALRAEVESMLRGMEAPHPILDEPLVKLEGDGSGDQGPEDHDGKPAPEGVSPEAETLPARGRPGGRGRLPDKIGGYTTMDVLGSGGMGTVYLAMQETPRRKVALKIMKRGVTSRSALRRFEFEAQLLARLRHPGIAQIYEAGTHDDGEGGVPFFAMEYVPSARSLTAYAREKKLDPRARLELLAKVCDAVGYGHQRGIIHRDLKPANVLVDTSGQPKIIDFGVARATDSDLAVTTLQTDIRTLVGTLQYMSPEQCGGVDSLDLDTSSDVYALGVVMYELLCGQPPYDLSNALPVAATKIICEQEPERPSTFDRTLRGDVETIALKALSKERDQRYRDAAALSEDIRRYLNDEPISARPPGLIDAARRFARRHTAAAVGIAGVFAVLLVAAVVFAVMFGTTQAARVTAESERTAAQEANRNAARAAGELWTTMVANAPTAWFDEAAAARARDARDQAGAAEAAREAGRPGEAAEGFIAAIAMWQEALGRQVAFVDELFARAAKAVEAKRLADAEQALERLQSIAAGDERLDPLRLEVAVLRLTEGMVTVPAGAFAMGSTMRSSEQPVHTVTFARPFLLSATEVTQAQFLAVTGRTPSRFTGNLNRPVERVTWFDAVDFCCRLSEREGLTPRYRITVKQRKSDGTIVAADVERVDGTGYRLPSEAEWEYACRAGTETMWSFGDSDERAGEYMWFGGNSAQETHPVGTLEPNAWGLFDMHGNVWEWCEDPWHWTYEGAPADGSVWTDGGDPSYRVLRGGAWDYRPLGCRSAGRFRYKPDHRFINDLNLGFRVALDPN